MFDSRTTAKHPNPYIMTKYNHQSKTETKDEREL